jgi:hypothetical protein
MQWGRVHACDTIGALGTAQRFGLDRIRQAGGKIIGVKRVFYEWLRAVEAGTAFQARVPTSRRARGYSAGSVCVAGAKGHKVSPPRQQVSAGCYRLSFCE